MDTTIKKVLILCHPKIVTGSFEPLILKNHWYGLVIQENKSIFEHLFLEYKLKGIPIFETVDIILGGTYKDDVFNDKFINEHLEEYDLVIVPDCGGPWYYLQNEENEENDIKFLEICGNLVKMLKPNGIIQFGKFLRDDNRKLVNRLEEYLNNKKFIVNYKNIIGIGHNIIAQKN
jgi:hypothetical protein